MSALIDDITNVMTEGLAVFDEDDRLVFFNHRYKEFYDKTGKNIRIGRKFEDILTDGLRSGEYTSGVGREKEWLRERLDLHKTPPHHPFEQQLSSGEWLLVSEKRLPNGGIIGVRTDITSLKEKEAGIRDSEQKFKDYTATASDWIWETDEHNRMKFLGGNHHLSGIEKKAVLGKTRNSVAVEDVTSAKWRELDEKIANHQTFRDFSYRIAGRNNQQLVVSISGVPVYDETGDFKGYRGTGRNITEQVLSNERLQAAETRMRAVFQSALLGMVLIDTNGIILEFNREAERMFQYRSDEVIGQNVSLLMPPFHAEQHDTYIANYLRTETAQIIGQPRRLTGKRKDGTLFPITLGVGKIELSDSIQFIGSVTDLTEQEQLENQLQRAQKLEAIGQLTGGIAHDFNNILGIVKGNLELGLRRAEDGSKIAGYFQKANRATERATKITQQLLSFSRQKEYYSDNLSCDLNHALSDVEALLQGSITKGVQLHIKVHDKPLIAHVDMGDLQDVIINLAVNARDAMHNKGILKIELSEISVSNRPPPSLKGLSSGQYGVVSVADCGPGIPEEIRSRIFEPFFTTKPKGHGTGLGLAMVYGFAKRCRGEIKVSSEAGVGTIFQIFIPLLDADKETIESINTNNYPPPRGKEKILIVDDEPDLATYAQVTLEDLGYRASTCSSPAAALEFLRTNADVDLVLSDVVMPGPVNGFELIAKVQKSYPEIKHLLTSGFPDEVLQGRGDSHSKLLIKPYDRQSLAAAVRTTLDEGSRQ
ncbi:PAS domain S-box protein [Labrenzia sp. PHM005]|uniref:PAS domain S-box protein n=1 Tax=Labrenzia sp. PHM005 TaxID=2590016 RepID=UPI001FFCF55D|nr:PAS domain S-box protein [Labrenzia sp. PHM005]